MHLANEQMKIDENEDPPKSRTERDQKKKRNIEEKRKLEVQSKRNNRNFKQKMK